MRGWNAKIKCWNAKIIFTKTACFDHLQAVRFCRYVLSKLFSTCRTLLMTASRLSSLSDELFERIHKLAMVCGTKKLYVLDFALLVIIFNVHCSFFHRISRNKIIVSNNKTTKKFLYDINLIILWIMYNYEYLEKLLANFLKTLCRQVREQTTYSVVGDTEAVKFTRLKCASVILCGRTR